MARSARLFLCARCRDQVLLCSHCDRGQVYCSRACSVASRSRSPAKRARVAASATGTRSRVSSSVMVQRGAHPALHHACQGGVGSGLAVEPAQAQARLQFGHAAQLLGVQLHALELVCLRCSRSWSA